MMNKELFLCIFTMLLVLCFFPATADDVQVIENAKILFKQGKYQQAEKILNTLSEPKSAEVHYLFAIINDPEYHYLSIQPSFPSYDDVRDGKAKFHYKKAVESGHCLASYYLNKYQLSRHNRRWVSKSTTTYSTNHNRRYKKTKSCLNESQHENNPEAIYLLSRLVTADTPEPGKKAMPMYRKVLAMAESGDALAQYYIGRMLTEGYFRMEEMRDYTRAFAWFTTAAYQGVHMSGVYALYVFEHRLDEKQKINAQSLAMQYIQDFIN